MEKDPTLLTVGEAAKRLGVHPKTLRRWTDAGRLPFIRLPSGHRRFRADLIERLTREIGPVAAEPETRDEEP
jgi:excisionase family DNA binding protein